jgi:hypothetical protein
MAIIRVHKRNSTFIDLATLVEEISNRGLTDTLKKYYDKPFEHEAKSIVAGPSFMQYLNKLFKIQIAAGVTEVTIRNRFSELKDRLHSIKSSNAI